MCSKVYNAHTSYVFRRHRIASVSKCFELGQLRCFLFAFLLSSKFHSISNPHPRPRFHHLLIYYYSQCQHYYHSSLLSSEVCSFCFPLPTNILYAPPPPTPFLSSSISPPSNSRTLRTPLLSHTSLTSSVIAGMFVFAITPTPLCDISPL